MARTGGVNFPKMFAHVRCLGLHERAGQEARTPPTTSEIDVVDATWSMEEYTATLDDDDIKFVGALDAEDRHRSRRTIEGPNEQRSGERNNIGDVWVVATYTGGGTPIRGPCAPAGGAAGLHAVRLVGDSAMSMHEHAAARDGLRRSGREMRHRVGIPASARRRTRWSASASSTRSRRPASASATWCRAPRCSPSTPAPRPSSMRWATGPARSAT